MGTLCCSSECERYLECELADINHVGLHTVEPFLLYGSGTFSDHGECVIEHWCGELGNWKMFEPVDRSRESYPFRERK